MAWLEISRADYLATLASNDKWFPRGSACFVYNGPEDTDQTGIALRYNSKAVKWYQWDTPVSFPTFREITNDLPASFLSEQGVSNAVS